MGVGYIVIKPHNTLRTAMQYSGFSVTTNNVNHYINPGFRSLRLASCKLKVFPESFRAMKQLQELDLSGNEINGQIPHWAGEIGRNELRLLNLSHNFITVLVLKSNNFHGNIQPSFSVKSPFPFPFQALLVLDLSHNGFVGIKGLAVLDLSQNHLVGRIPEGTQFNTFDESSFAENSGLCGFPLPKKCSERAHKPQLEEHEYHEEKSGFRGKVVIVGDMVWKPTGSVLGISNVVTESRGVRGGLGPFQLFRRISASSEL
ncbi:leucine-rich repeat-containing protein [Tanacetum coccineum]